MVTQLVLLALLSTLLAFLLSAAEAAIGRISRIRAQELGDEGGEHRRRDESGHGCVRPVRRSGDRGWRGR